MLDLHKAVTCSIVFIFILNVTKCFLHLTCLRTMMKWLETLPFHNYEVSPPGGECEPSPLLKAYRLLTKPDTSLPAQNDEDCIEDDVSRCTGLAMFHWIVCRCYSLCGGCNDMPRTVNIQ